MSRVTSGPAQTYEQQQYRRTLASLGGLAYKAQYGMAELSKAGVRGQQLRYERQVDPNGVLPLAERRERADAAMRANMKRLALIRQQKAQSRKLALAK